MGTSPLLDQLLSASPILSSMTSPIELQNGAAYGLRLRSRGDLTAFLTELAEGVGADFYMLLTAPQGAGAAEARILASNWVFDAIELAVQGLIARIAAHWATAPGQVPRALHAAAAPGEGAPLAGEEARLLHVLGHGEIWALRVCAGRRGFLLLFSSEASGAIRAPKLPRAQLECGYALSRMPGLLLAAAAADPLSDRERECLLWVSEGKTTEEVALILGVAANTVNSYLTHAMQKLGASNRAMAIATAIRSGMI